MSHFAELNEENVVVRVVVGNSELSDADGLVEITQLLGGNWLQTSYNAAQNGFRGNYAGIGYWYLPKEDLFIPAKCHEEAILNVENALWTCTNKEHDVKPAN